MTMASQGQHTLRHRGAHVRLPVGDVFGVGHGQYFPSEGGGAVGGAPPPPSGDPELVEVPKAPDKSFDPKLICAEGTRKIFSLAEVPEKNLPNHLRGGGGCPRGGGGWGVSDPSPRRC